MPGSREAGTADQGAVRAPGHHWHDADLHRRLGRGSLLWSGLVSPGWRTMWAHATAAASATWLHPRDLRAGDLLPEDVPPEALPRPDLPSADLPTEDLLCRRVLRRGQGLRAGVLQMSR